MQALIDNPDADRTLILAHGAGAPMDSPFMDAVASAVAAQAVRVVRFEFPYMAQRRADGKQRPPNGQKVLLETWRAVFAQERAAARPIFVGGKSMGGRMASLLADELEAAGLVCLGYPFHPPGKPEKTRVEHLAALTTPALIVQGTRDPFGTPAEVEGYALSPAIEVTWIDTGDHSLVPTKSSGRTAADAWAEAAARVVRFIEAHS